MAIRSAAKAVILHNNKVLVNKYVDHSEKIQNYPDLQRVYYELPGGGQNQFETMEDAVIREVLEETGYHVKVERFLALAEEINDNKEVREKYYDYSHRILHIFLVNITSDHCEEASERDLYQEDSIWMTLDEIDKVTFRPKQLTGNIRALVSKNYPQYLGVAHEP